MSKNPVPPSLSDIDVRIDARGVEHHRARPDPRIVSLVPSLTELLCDLGVGSQIVGCTRFCIHPRETVRRIEKVGGTKDVDIEKIRALAPTHVIVNVDENPRETVDALSEVADNVFVTHPIAPTDNLVLFENFGFLFSCEERAAELAQRFRFALDRLPTCGDRPARKVLYLIWRNPWMAISPDTYISRMLALVNWHSVPRVSADRYPTIELANFVGETDLILLSSEPYPFSDEHFAEVESEFGERAQIALVDGEMFSWYGSRAIPAVEYLDKLTVDTAEILPR